MNVQLQVAPSRITTIPRKSPTTPSSFARRYRRNIPFVYTDWLEWVREQAIWRESEKGKVRQSERAGVLERVRHSGAIEIIMSAEESVVLGRTGREVRGRFGIEQGSRLSLHFAWSRYSQRCERVCEQERTEESWAQDFVVNVQDFARKRRGRDCMAKNGKFV